MYVIDKNDNYVINDEKIDKIRVSDFIILRYLYNKIFCKKYLKYASNDVNDKYIFYHYNKNLLNKNISKIRDHIYYEPGNILSLCHEVNFNIKIDKFNIKSKLEYIFDIKNEFDCSAKIDFYL